MIAQKSKAPLNLMEQVVMILIFAFAAALCVQAFVLADTMSKEAYARDKAAMISQTMAETVKSQHGDMEKAAVLLGEMAEATQEGLFMFYDSAWEATDKASAKYIICMEVKEADDYISKGEINVLAAEEEEIIFTLPVSWQN